MPMTGPELSVLQAAMLDLIKTGPGDEAFEDPYLGRVQRSTELTVVREIVGWWRAQTVGVGAPLTSGLLRCCGRLDAAIADLSARADLSAFRELATEQFLVALRGDGDPLVSAMADFESALMAVRSDPDLGPHITRWPCDPYVAVAAALSGGRLPSVSEVPYFTEVSADMPGYFRLVGAGGPTQR